MSLPPLSSGSRVRVHNLLELLSDQHQVRQFCLSWGERYPQREQVTRWDLAPDYLQYRYSNPIAWASAAVAQRSWVRVPLGSGAALRLTRPKVLDELLHWADVVLVEFPWQFEYCRLRLRRLHLRAPLVLAAHNVERLKFESWASAAGVRGSSLSWTGYVGRAEAGAVASADLVIAVSGADRDLFVSRYGVDPADIVVVPNGADTGAYTPSDDHGTRQAKQQLGLPDKPTVLFVGADVAPNRAGLRHVERLAQLTDRFHFLVVGTVATPHQDRHVTATGFVDDLRLYIRASDFAICPIEHGGGTKIKLLEALAAGLPTVVFPESVHGLETRNREHVMVAKKTPSSMLAALSELDADRTLANRMGGAGRALVVDHYSWRKSAGRLEEALSALVEPLRVA
jgi:polysaccharide biosynthesis protein PslH